MRGKLFALIFVILGVMLLASCGGGTIVAPDPGGNNNPPAAGDGPQTFDQWSADTELGDVPKTVRGIPPIPTDGEHGASDADNNKTVLGKDAIDFSQCEIDGDSMLINAGAVADTNPEDIPAWAMYKVSGLGDLDPLSLNVECQPGSYGQEYSVAVADYTVLEWKWFGPTGLPELEANLADDHKYITNIGNLYFLVVCYDANTATHFQSTVVAQPVTTPELPGAPARLVASKGEIENGVGLTWLAGAGADYYEIYRQGHLWRFADDDPPPPGFRPGWDPENDEWEQIGVSEVTQYLDEDVIPGIVYSYKVRSANAVGVSRFSEIDEGWAYDEWEPPFEGIHGYVFGEMWNFWDGEEPPPGDDFDPSGGGIAPGPCPGMLPLQGATITLANFLEGAGPDFVYTTHSDADGYYQFDQDIRPGMYLLFAELEGWVFYDRFEVPVEEPMPPMQFDFFGVPEGTRPPGEPEDGVHGWVWGDTWNGDPTFDPEGDPGTDPGFAPTMFPLEGALVRVIDPETEDEIARTTTDVDGFYQFLVLPAGVYRMTCELDTWYFQPEEHWFDIPEGEMPSLAFDFWGIPEHLRPPPPPPLPEGLSGYVFDVGDPTLGDGGTPPGLPVPMAGVDIAVTGDDGVVSYTAVTNDGGFYHIPDIAAGFYLVQAVYEGYWFDPPEHPVYFAPNEMEPVQVDFYGFEGIEPRPGPWPPIDGDGILGTVFSDVSRDPMLGFGPLAGVTISAFNLETGDLIATTLSNTDGFFHIPLADLGDGGVFSVTAELGGYMFEPEEHHVYLTGGLMHSEIEFLGFWIGVEPPPPPPGNG